MANKHIKMIVQPIKSVNDLLWLVAVPRRVHIHFKIRIADGYDFTSQLFFDDPLTDEVFAQPPCNSRSERNLRNDNDGIYARSGGQTLLAVNSTEVGYAAAFDVALDISSTIEFGR